MTRQITILADDRVPSGWFVGISGDALKVLDQFGNDVTEIATATSKLSTGWSASPVREADEPLNGCGVNWTVDSSAIARTLQRTLLNQLKPRMQALEVDAITKRAALHDAKQAVERLTGELDVVRYNLDALRRAYEVLDAEYRGEEHQTNSDAAGPSQASTAQYTASPSRYGNDER